MTNQSVIMTCEQFTGHVLKYRLTHPEIIDRDQLIEATCLEQFGDDNRDRIFNALVTNSIHKKMDHQDRETQREVDRWIDVGQLDLFGYEGLSLPEFMTIGNRKKHWTEATLAETQSVLKDFHEQTTLEADELALAWNKKKAKAETILSNLLIVEKLINDAVAMGLDPNELTYEKAKITPPPTRPNDGSGDKAKI